MWLFVCQSASKLVFEYHRFGLFVIKITQNI